MTSAGGLRERKKVATRVALTAAALQLAAERGVGQVSAEEIADVAGVSVRTFYNYFASKEEAFVADDLERGHLFVERVAAAPADAALWQLLHRTALETLVPAEEPTREQALKEQLVRTDPAVLTEVLAAFARLEQALVVELMRRSPAGELRARLLANAVVTAVRAATETWLSPDADPGTPFASLLDEAFTTLAPAFP